MYTVRQLFKDTFQVARFEDYKEPTAVYHISGKRCSCPARNPCKHQSIIKTFKELEQGAWGFEFVGTQVQPFSLTALEI